MRFMSSGPSAFLVSAAVALAGCSPNADSESSDAAPEAALAVGDAEKAQTDTGRSKDDLFVSGPKRSGELDLNATNLAYLYHRMSGEPASLARMMTKPLGMRFDNEFARRRFLEENFDEFTDLVDEAVAAETYLIELNGRLEDYDFDREGFPIHGLFDRTMVNFSASESGSEGLDFALALEGAGEMSFLPMSPEEAESLSNSRNSRSVDLEVAFTPIEAGWEQVRSDQKRTVRAKAYRVRVLSRDGNEIGKITSDAQPSNAPLRLYADNPFAKAKLTNPWSADNAPEAVLDRYAWIIDERWQMSNYSDGDKFDEAMSLNGSSAGGCVDQFGYSECQRISQRRSDFIARCTQSVPEQRKRDCNAIRRLPYTRQEADAL